MAHLPRPGVLSGLDSSDNPSLLPGGALNTAGGLGLLAQVPLVGGPHLGGHPVDLLHQHVAVGVHHGGPGLVLAQVARSRGPPVLLGTEPAALRGGLGGKIVSKKKKSKAQILDCCLLCVCLLFLFLTAAIAQRAATMKSFML